MADFERRNPGGQQSPQGFDETSYRASGPAEEARALTPLQQKLAGLEKALPKALRSRAAALLLALLVLFGGAVGLGGAKLRARYNEAAGWYTAGVPADNGYTLSDELNERAYTAANVITTAINTPGLGTDAPPASGRTPPPSRRPRWPSTALRPARRRWPKAAPA